MNLVRRFFITNSTLFPVFYNDYNFELQMLVLKLHREASHFGLVTRIPRMEVARTSSSFIAEYAAMYDELIDVVWKVGWVALIFMKQYNYVLSRR